MPTLSAALLIFNGLLLLGHSRLSSSLGLTAWGGARLPDVLVFLLANVLVGVSIFAPRGAWLTRCARSPVARYVSVAWVALLVLVAGVSLGSGLLTPTLYNNDARIYTFAFWPTIDAALLPGDPSVDYVNHLMPPGYRLVLAGLTSACGHPLLAANLLSVALSLLTLCLLYVLGSRLAGPWAGALAAVCFWQSPDGLTFLAGAHPRAFCLPLLATCLACWVWRRERLALAVAFAAALLYPPAFALLGVTGALRLGHRLWQRQAHRADALAFVLVHCLAAGLTLAWLHSNPYGSPLSGSEALLDLHWSGANPRYSETVRVPFPSLTRELGAGLRDALPLSFPGANLPRGPASGAALACALLALLLPFLEGKGRLRDLRLVRRALRRSPLWRDMLALGCATLGLYLLARWIPYRLYVPSRYLTYCLPLLVALSLSGFLALAARVLRRRAPALALSVALLVAWFGAESLLNERSAQPADRGWMDVSTGHPRALEAVAQLPIESVLFASGRLASDIPLWARRRTLWNPETYQVFHLPYAEACDERLRRACDALLDPDWATARSRWETLGVTHLVFDEQTWADPRARARIFYSPIYEQLGARLRAASAPPWEHIPSAQLLFRDERYSLWRVSP